MTDSDTFFRTWRYAHHLSAREAAERLGRSLRQIQWYDAGSDVPAVVRVAMRAVEADLHGENPDGR